jgi:6-pyruvoyltetrahydropterin/6-carboxytetrahydropterin synthase
LIDSIGREFGLLVEGFMFRVTQEIDFCYGHRLLNYAGKCRHLHGHNGRLLITLEAAELDSRGMLVDFSDIKQSIRTWVDNELDHRMILNEADPIIPSLRKFDEPLFIIPHNPTAENIARLVFELTRDRGFPVVEVSLWETPKSYATYRA